MLTSPRAIARTERTKSESGQSQLLDQIRGRDLGTSVTIDVAQVIPDPGENLDTQAVKDFSEVAVDQIDSLEIKYEGPM